MLRAFKRLRRFTPRGVARIALYVMVAVLLFASVYFPVVYTHNATTGAVGVAPWFAVVAFGITSWAAAESRRPKVTGDIVRVLSWTVLAFGLGLRMSAGSYYAFFHPQHAPFWQGVGLGVACIGAFAILLSLMFSPPRRRWRKGECPTCGYNSEHLTSDRCPECGHHHPTLSSGGQL